MLGGHTMEIAHHFFFPSFPLLWSDVNSQMEPSDELAPRKTFSVRKKPNDYHMQPTKLRQAFFVLYPPTPWESSPSSGTSQSQLLLELALAIRALLLPGIPRGWPYVLLAAAGHNAQRCLGAHGSLARRDGEAVPSAC